MVKFHWPKWNWVFSSVNLLNYINGNPEVSKNTTKKAEIAVTTPPKTIAPFPRGSPLDLATKPKIKPIGPRIIPKMSKPIPEHAYDALINPFCGGFCFELRHIVDCQLHRQFAVPELE